MGDEMKSFAEIDAESRAFRSTLERARKRAESIRNAKAAESGVKDTQAALVAVLERLVDPKRGRTWEPG